MPDFHGGELEDWDGGSKPNVFRLAQGKALAVGRLVLVKDCSPTLAPDEQAG
jgi:hypothetical protein